MDRCAHAPRRTAGVTLTELLVALAVFSVVLLLAGAGVIYALRVARHNEGVLDLQAQTRRASQVIAEELRSLAFGAISDTPYASTSSSISFLLPSGPAWPVYPHDSGQNASFVNAANVQIGASVANAAALQLEDGSAIMRNGYGDAIALAIGNVTRRGGPTSRTWNLVHPACANTIDYTAGTTLLQAASTIGYAHDPDARTIWRTEGASTEALAFNVDTFTITYVYETDAGAIVQLDAPLRGDEGAPLRVAEHEGAVVVLDAIRVDVQGFAEGPFGTIRRGYSTQAPLPQYGPQTAQVILPCG